MEEKSGSLSIKHDLDCGKKTSSRSWQKYKVVLKEGCLELHKEKTDTIVETISLENSLVISDKVYKSGDKKVIILKLPNESQYLLNPVLEDSVSWILALEQSIQAIHARNISKISRQLNAANNWLSKMDGNDELPEVMLQSKEKAKAEVKNLTTILDELKASAPKKSTSLADFQQIPENPKKVTKARSNTARADSYLKAQQKILNSKKPNLVFTNDLFEESTRSSKEQTQHAGDSTTNTTRSNQGMFSVPSFNPLTNSQTSFVSNSNSPAGLNSPQTMPLPPVMLETIPPPARSALLQNHPSMSSSGLLQNAPSFSGSAMLQNIPPPNNSSILQNPSFSGSSILQNIPPPQISDLLPSLSGSALLQNIPSLPKISSSASLHLSNLLPISPADDSSDTPLSPLAAQLAKAKLKKRDPLTPL